MDIKVREKSRRRSREFARQIRRRRVRFGFEILREENLMKRGREEMVGERRQTSDSLRVVFVPYSKKIKWVSRIGR